MESNLLNILRLDKKNNSVSRRLQFCKNEKASSSSLQRNSLVRLESLDFYDVIITHTLLYSEFFRLNLK